VSFFCYTDSLTDRERGGSGAVRPVLDGQQGRIINAVAASKYCASSQTRELHPAQPQHSWTSPTQLPDNDSLDTGNPLHCQTSLYELNSHDSGVHQPVLVNCVPIENPRGPEAQVSGSTIPNFAVHTCTQAGCDKSFKYKGDLTRHVKVHTQLTEHHCHISLCPRSIFGDGFH
jgi:uncharacterized Zn-finger protein